MNYAIFLYNQGDRQGAAEKLINFRKNFDSIVQGGKRREIDSEVINNKTLNFNSRTIYNIFLIYQIKKKLAEVSSKLGPILNITNNSEVKSNLPTTSSSSSDQSLSAQKYTSISDSATTNTNNYKRESTVASASNVGVDGTTSRINSAASNYDSASSSSSRPGTSTNYSEMMRKNFENF